MCKGIQGNGQFVYASRAVDAGLRLFPYVPSTPHVANVFFKKGVMSMVGGASRNEKTLAAHSMGKIPSSHFVTMLLMLYFVIGDKGYVLPNTKDFMYKKPKGGGAVNLKNVTEKVLTAIRSILDLYFECKKSAHTDSSLIELEKLVKTAQIRYLLVWELVQTMLCPNDARIFMMRKLHFPSHFAAIIKQKGCLLSADTNGYERIHKVFTTGVWDVTSQR
jgi:hypothetical protein